MRTLLTGLSGLLALAVCLYVICCLLLYWKQDSLLFYPVYNDPSLRRNFERSHIELQVDGALIEGWSIENPQATTDCVILYFGGNAEDVLQTASLSNAFAARRFIAFNYRGYGHSTGAPSQTALYADALKVYDYVMASGAQPEHLVVIGRSLGSGVASMLAGNRRMAGTILVTPFDSLASVAAGHYPFFPVRLLLRHPFPSIDWAHAATAPTLFLAADHDDVVPAKHAMRLFDAWRSRKQFHLLAGRDHNDIDQDADYYRLINTFLGTLP